MVLSELSTALTSALSSLNDPKVRLNQELLDSILKQIGNALLKADVDLKLVTNMRKNLKNTINLSEMGALNKNRIVMQKVKDELISLLDPGSMPYKPKKGITNVIMLVGLQGAGKTTTISKIGYYYRCKGFKVGVVAADTYRAGAYMQLKQNALKAKIAFTGDSTETDPVKAALDGVKKFRTSKFDIVLVDTSGRHMQADGLFEEMKQIEQSINPHNVVFVLDASIGQAAREQAQAFKTAVNVGSVVITKLDGHAKGGGALSAVAATQSPILFIGTGEHLEDLESFQADTFVTKLLGGGDIGGMMEKMASAFQNSDAMNDEEKMKALEKMSKGGKFTLRDMRQYYELMQSMGSMTQMMEMIPGMSSILNANKDAGGVNVSDDDIKRKLRNYVVAMDSMTNKELDNPKLLASTNADVPSRMMRIARGSGIRIEILYAMIEEYKKLAVLMERMGKVAPKMSGKGAGGARAMNQNVAELARGLPPNMLQQFGGLGGLQSLMRQQQGGGGGGGLNMEAISKMLGGGKK